MHQIRWKCSKKTVHESKIIASPCVISVALEHRKYFPCRDCGSVSEGCAIVVPGAYAEQVFIIALENEDASNSAISESHQTA